MDAQTKTIKQALRAIPQVLGAKGLTTRIDWVAAGRDGRRYLFAVLDVNDAIRASGSLKPYCDPGLTHDMSTLIGGHPVVLGNHSGLRYCVPLTAAPRLPANAPLPDSIPFDRECVPLGVGFSGAIGARPETFISALVTGAQGSGKSTLLKALAFAARAHGWALYLADARGHTFNPDAWNTVAASPVAQTGGELMAMIRSLAAELNRRAELYRAVARDGLLPDNLDDYNREAARRGSEQLPYFVFIADEANSFLKVKGAGEALEDVIRHGRKWGLLVVMAAHSWRADDAARSLTMLLHVRVCFRVDDDTSGTVALGSKVWGKKAMSLNCPGRGLIAFGGGRPQMFQAYNLDRERERALLVAARNGECPVLALSDVERRALTAARANGGRMTLATLTAAGLHERQARRLVEQFALRGWARKDTMQANATVLTETAPKANDER